MPKATTSACKAGDASELCVALLSNEVLTANAVVPAARTPTIESVVTNPDLMHKTLLVVGKAEVQGLSKIYPIIRPFHAHVPQ